MKVFPSINFNNDFDGDSTGIGFRNCYKGSFIITFSRFTYPFLGEGEQVFEFPQSNDPEASTIRITTLNLQIVQSDHQISSPTQTYYYDILASAYSNNTAFSVDITSTNSVVGGSPNTLIDWQNSITYSNYKFYLTLIPLSPAAEITSVLKGFYLLY